MPANKELLQKRYTRIITRFDELSAATTKNGKRKNNYAVIIEKLAEEFCYSEKTIERICTNRQAV